MVALSANYISLILPSILTQHHNIFIFLTFLSPLCKFYFHFLSRPIFSLQMGDSSKSQTSNLYSILGIPKSANLSEICKAYKSLVMKWHPDRNPSNKSEAEAKFFSINEAYRVRPNIHSSFFFFIPLIY